jgi:signal transduction histidine kinase
MIPVIVVLSTLIDQQKLERFWKVLFQPRGKNPWHLFRDKITPWGDGAELVTGENKTAEVRMGTQENNRTISELGYKGIIDLLPCYLSIQDRSLNILYANENFKKDFGKNTGKPCHVAYKGSWDICESCPVLASFEDKRVHISEENVLLSSGEVVQLIVYSAPVINMLGNVDAVIEMSANITKVKEMQKELTFLGQSIATLTHDMKNILEALQGGTYVIEEGIKDGDIGLTGRGWDIVKRNIAEISNITQNILYSSKKRDIECLKASPGKIVKDVVNLFQEKALTMDIKLGHFVNARLPLVNLDSFSMRRVLSNLVWNALEACKKDQSKDFRTVILKADFYDRSNFMFEVEDDGVGMDEFTLENVFQKFYSKKGNDATGLGLYVVDKIVKEHGGRIEVLSSPGKGSTFRVVLDMK